MNISADDTVKYPTRMGNRCYTVMKKALRTKDVNILDNVFQRVTTDSFWSLHTEQSCSVYTHYVAQDKEGRPAKDRWLKKRQREASASFDPPDRSTPQKTKRVSYRCSNISIPNKNIASSPGCRCYRPDRKIWFCCLPNISSQTVAV